MDSPSSIGRLRAVIDLHLRVATAPLNLNTLLTRMNRVDDS